MFETYSQFLFPRQVILSRDLEYETYKDELVNYCLNKKVQNPIGEKYTNMGGWQSDSILDDPKLPKIFEKRLKLNLNRVQNELNLTHNCYIHRMWIQISQKNCYNNRHSHPFSHYSGVFYVKSTNSAECGRINLYPFNDANNYQELLYRNPEWLNKNNMNTHKSYVPHEGLVIMFPSGLPHCVSENETNTDRISIAFDVLFKGND